jgi:hypothetical protein
MHWQEWQVGLEAWEGEAMREAAARAKLLAFVLSVVVAPAHAQSERTTHIHIVIDEIHERITSDGNLPIEKLHEYNVTLSGTNQVNEVWVQTNIGIRTGDYKHSDPGGENATTIGGSRGVVWHVLGDHKLQRIRAGEQIIEIWDLKVDNGNSCNIDARFLLQKGTTYFIANIAGTSKIAHFTVPKVQHATCTIE